MSRDIIDLIDTACNDYLTSGDAMRWKPPEPVWNDPVVRNPTNLIEELMLCHGLDGYAATLIARRVTEETMRNMARMITRSLQDSMHQFAIAANNVAIQLRPVFDQINNIGDFTASETQCVARPIPIRRVVVPRDGRPAWETPYGPRGRR